MSSNGLLELSGLFWNGSTNRLYVVHGDGHLRVLQLNGAGTSFSQIGNVAFPVNSGPEGITLVNLNANEFYTVDENNYQIRKYTHPSSTNFTLTQSKSWNLVGGVSPMTNTGIIGPEGIAFIPDSFLIANGFISQATGLPYVSIKGMGGLIFIAHQTGGYIWVFDINPNTSNDMVYVGKYRTNKQESCELAFDKTTGLLYILHNVFGNSLEVTDLSTFVSVSERKFTVINEYTVTTAAGNNSNIEGFAITSKCNDSTNVSAWLCRDVESLEALSLKQDCIRWFKPFSPPGFCNPGLPVTLNLRVLIQGFYTGNGSMRPAVNSAIPTLCDTITVELHRSASPYGIVQTKKSTINITGNGSFIFPSNVYGKTYYIVVKHRNSLETWSAVPITFNNINISYSFVENANKAYGLKQMSLVGGYFGLYSGDVNQNGTINVNDFTQVGNKARSFSTGYIVDDINGDRIIESADHTIVETNYRLGISISKP
jgi:hypothetical protein